MSIGWKEAQKRYKRYLRIARAETWAEIWGERAAVHAQYRAKTRRRNRRRK